MKGYDIDGVITAGYVPESDAIIITGRSYEMAPETYAMLHRMCIFNAVYFNPLALDDTTIENSGGWKGEMINKFGITEFYEDDLGQIEAIKKINYNCKIHYVDTASE